MTIARVTGGAEGLALPERLRGMALALGNFDGVHLGHAHLLAALHRARPDLKLGVLTFEPHPREFFRPEDPPFRLTLAPERAALLEQLGVAAVIELGFDAAFSRLSAEAFVLDVLVGAAGARHLACGADFAFGHRRGGSVALLGAMAERLGLGLTVVPPLADGGGTLSSSRIRRWLQDGYPEQAAEALGRPWAITGTVAHGDARGRTIGFPTANLALGRHLEPARGVYAVMARLEDGRRVPGVANVGRRPTVAEGAVSRVEAHLFDLSEDLYGQVMQVALHRFLREERRFEGLDALREQIGRDAEQARAIWSKRPSV